MSTFGKLVVAGIVVFAVLQALRPSIPIKSAIQKSFLLLQPWELGSVSRAE
jgi:ABC-type enterobactin transport system permease subunit